MKENFVPIRTKSINEISALMNIEYTVEGCLDCVLPLGLERL